MQARIIYDEALSLRTVERWSKWFRDGREEVEDKAQSGRPVIQTASENIEQVRLSIDDDYRTAIEESQEQTGLSYGATHLILLDHLKLRKITARYISKHVVDFQRAKWVRICKQNLAKFEAGTWRLCDVVSGDESWSIINKLGEDH